MRRIQESLGEPFPEHGLGRVEHDEECHDALQQVKAQVIEEFAHGEHERRVWRKQWAFSD